MSLILLSNNIEPQIKTLTNVVLTCIKANLRIVINHNSINSLDAIEVYIDRKYGEVPVTELEYFSMDIHSEKYIKEQFDSKLTCFKINLFHYYGLAGTDQADYDHLIYDFCLSYLRLNPEHCISLYGDTFFFLKDLEEIESKRGYYKDWCF
jgi:hypothetical protein